MVALLTVPAIGAAQGFGVYEHGSCTMGRAGVAAAHPCDDGSAIFFNPAGLAGLAGTRATAGVTVITASGGFTDDVTLADFGLDNPTIPVPHAYFTHQLSPRVTLGLGGYAPYGLETRWKLDGFQGRFLGYNTELRAIYVQPTLGWQATPRMKLGVGVAYINSSVELHQRADLSTLGVPGQAFTFATLGVP
ncbi:MAG: OmpP1/FadL family transporter, partial [Gemmatimonadales bacterium]